MPDRPSPVDRRPPLYNGGHVFVPLAPIGDYVGPPLWRCTRCVGIVPRWALTDGSVPVLLGRVCRALLPALEAAPGCRCDRETGSAAP